jgi:PAS domain S-box-containing protein
VDSGFDEALATLTALAGLELQVDDTAGAVPTVEQGQFAEVRYQTLIEQIPAVTFLASLAGGRNEMYVSPQIESLLGFSQKEWLEDPVLWYTRLHPEDRDRTHAAVQAALDPGGTGAYAIDYRVLWPDGTVRWMQGKGAVIVDDDGQVLGTICNDLAYVPGAKTKDERASSMANLVDVLFATNRLEIGSYTSLSAAEWNAVLMRMADVLLDDRRGFERLYTIVQCRNGSTKDVSCN